ncbi:unnamed protein product [Enterobius vermicularis]|uniref:3-hydroxyacyl-CoA dehydrogenase n=1 Tax=Enterobius vermicularis TaxID=51028 RepID=A0A0N4VKY0_ENTVE|nr:unnamed protein product [Enterobius vermicularis]
MATPPLKNITIIGSGLMGSGIAQVAAQAKHSVILVDQTEEILHKSEKSIQKSLERVAKKKFTDPQAGTSMVQETLKNIKFSTAIGDAVKNANLVIEAVTENLGLKQKLLREIERSCSPDAILASNTSSFSLKEISKDSKYAQNFAGLHFFNPVPMMKLVEVVRTDMTKQTVYDQLMEFAKGVGKVPVACKDTPGFIVNRLLVPYMFEALRMVERGDATIKDVDAAMKLGAGYPMGPFELADYVGLDTMKFILDGWHASYPNEVLFKPSPYLDKLVSEGKLGKKSGEGFYEYTGKK